MKQILALCISVLLQLTYYTSADKHTYGEYLNFDYNARRYFHRTVIDDKNEVPKNYTLFYKYFGSKFKDVQYFEIAVNTHSEGHVNVYNNNIDAKIQINNASNVTATISIFGSLPANLPRYVGFSRSEYNQKSFTFVHIRNATNVHALKPFAQNSIGNRRQRDKLVHFESRNVTNKSRFPSRSFEYSGDEYITYVGFSFTSPTAVVMVNTTYVNEQDFNAVVYDMNSEHFVANISVYGIARRPDGFVGVI